MGAKKRAITANTILEVMVLIENEVGHVRGHFKFHMYSSD
jgi:hypothetical protein